jgi:hypothetical protein
MEALASGAMVMTDPMYPLPDNLEDGKRLSLYDYKTMDEFKANVSYYCSSGCGTNSDCSERL